MKSAHVKTIYYCKACGNEHLKWQGKCSACKEWNTLVEKQVLPTKKQINKKSEEFAQAELLDQISVENHNRLLFEDQEINRVMGGGIMPGSISLIAGEPGIGKSTLLLQLSLQASTRNIKTLYVSGEESKQQIKDRAKRISNTHNNIYIASHTLVQYIIDEAKRLQPSWIIIDSIQTITSANIETAAGSMAQLRESTTELQYFAKTSGIPIILIGHINKEGIVAGPKVLEHIVDTVILFEGDRHYDYRMLRTLKNRFGSAAEVGIYEMTQDGLRPILNPSELLLNRHGRNISGTSVGCTAEGLRCLFVEVQALVTKTFYGMPQRTVSGIEQRKVQLLSAVLEKRCGFQLGTQDIFLSLVGGIKTEDPAIDLAAIAALISSYHDITIPSTVCFAGEVGLSGEIRAVSKITKRIQEAEKVGFTSIVCSAYNFKEKHIKNKSIHVHQVQDIADTIKLLKKLSSIHQR